MAVNLKRDSAALPETRTETIERVRRGGVIIEDPYTWLEDSSSPEVRKWTREQNRFSRCYLDRTPLREELVERLAQFYASMPKSALDTPTDDLLPSGKTRHFGICNVNGSSTAALCYRDGERGETKIAFDPVKLSRSGNFALNSFFPNYDGTKVAFTVSYKGSDTETLMIVDLEKGKLLKEKIRGLTFTNLVWTMEGSSFYYSTWPSPENGGNPRNRYRVYQHELGRSQASDRGIFGKGLGPQISCDLKMLGDTEDILVISSGDNLNQEIHTMKVKTGVVKPLVLGMDAFFDVCAVVGKKVYLETNLNAPNYKIVAFDMNAPSRRNWRDLVRENGHPIDAVYPVAGKFVITYVNNIHSEIGVFNYGGARLFTAKLPHIGYATGISGTDLPHKIEFSFESFFSSPLTYLMDLHTGEVSKARRKANVGIKIRDMEVIQTRYESRDGTEIPMFVLKNRDTPIDGNAPVLMTGYGGFRISMMPEFGVGKLPFIQDGGIFAIPNIRGGGEFGSNWYTAGRSLNKRTSFDDFTAAAEWLIEMGYAKPERLAAWGSSNGGLLVAAAMVQRPELFRAIVCDMPITDLAMFDKFGLGKILVSEYGDPSNPIELRKMLRFSPYHNVKDNVKYPSLLILTAENDTRSHPMHARKFAASVQSSTRSDNPVMIQTYVDTGHGDPSQNTSRRIQANQSADALTFIYRELGMEIRRARETGEDLQDACRPS